jgi:Hsp70 protein
VFDLGGGTFDVCVVRRTGNRFRVVGEPDGSEFGGEDVDARLWEHLGTTALDPEQWEDLRTADDVEWRRANFEFRRHVRDAKEAVSKSATQPVLVPAPVSRELHVTRDGLEELIRDDIEETLAITKTTLARAGVTPEQLAAVYLVGGSSRIPLVLHMVRERLGRADFKGDPKAVVALGAVAFDSTLVGEAPRRQEREPAKKRPPWLVPAIGAAIALAVALFVIMLKGTTHVGGVVVDSQGKPLKHQRIEISVRGQGTAWYRTKTDDHGRFRIAAKKDPKDSKSPQPTAYNATAIFPWKGGVWRFDLVGDPDNVEHQDHMRFQAKVSGRNPDMGDSYGGAVHVSDSLASTSLSPPANSLTGMYGGDAVLTLHFEPQGRLVDGTQAKPFDAQVRLGDAFMGGTGVPDVPLGSWRVTAEINGPDGSDQVFFGDGTTDDASPEGLVEFGPDQPTGWLSVLPDPQLVAAPGAGGQGGAVDSGGTVDPAGTLDDGGGSLDDGSLGEDSSLDDGSLDDGGSMDDGSLDDGSLDEGGSMDDGSLDDGSLDDGGSLDDSDWLEP